MWIVKERLTFALAQADIKAAEAEMSPPETGDAIEIVKWNAQFCLALVPYFDSRSIFTESALQSDK